MAKVLAASLSYCKYSLNAGPGEILRSAGIELEAGERSKAYTEAELLDVIAQYDGIIVGTDPMTERVIQAGKQLKIIAKNGVGYDNVDLKAATARGIYVTFTPGAVEQTVADSTFALIFALGRQIVQGDAAIRRGEWKRAVGINLSNKKLGIVGLGRIGKNVVLRSRGFNMQVYASDPYADQAFCAEHSVRLVDLDELFATCDIVSIHAPLLEATRHLVNQRTLSLMKPGALLINTARGELVDEAALVRALQDKKIGGAALDVFSKEPLPGNSPLRALDNVILTPHTAGYSYDTLIASGMMIAESILAALKGQVPPHLVNPAPGQERETESRR